MDDLSVSLTLNRADFTLQANITIPATGVTAIFGPSGSGKTTLLRCIAGLENTASGTVIFKQTQWQTPNIFVPTHKREIGYVFQEASLFEHLTARKNLEYAIKRSSSASKLDLTDTAKLLGIEHLLERYPDALSGGERQRVAIARALLVQPALLFMDEPLAALDQSRKAEILPYLETLKQELSLPILYVSHAIEEIARLADHMIVMQQGNVVMDGNIKDVMARLDFSHIQGEETASLLEATITGRNSEFHLCTASTGSVDLQFRDISHRIGDKVRVRIFARDISLALSKPSDSSVLNRFEAVVVDVKKDTHPGLVLVKLDIGQGHIIARISAYSAHELGIHKGLVVWALIKSVAIVQ